MAFSFHISDTGQTLDVLASLSVHVTYAIPLECSVYFGNCLVLFTLTHRVSDDGSYLELHRLSGDRNSFANFICLFATTMKSTFLHKPFEPLPFPHILSEHEIELQFQEYLAQLKESNPNPDAAMHFLFKNAELTESRADLVIPHILKIAETSAYRLFSLSLLLKLIDFASLPRLRECLPRVISSILSPERAIARHERREAIRVAIELACYPTFKCILQKSKLYVPLAHVRMNSSDKPAQQLAYTFIRMLVS